MKNGKLQYIKGGELLSSNSDWVAPPSGCDVAFFCAPSSLTSLTSGAKTELNQLQPPDSNFSKSNFKIPEAPMPLFDIK
jgi:hypothetical protein